MRVSKPTRRIRNEITIDAMYSILACPNGWSRSAGFADILKLTNVMIDEPASERLFNASAIIAADALIIPIKSLIKARNIFVHIPTTLVSEPYAFLTVGFFVSL